MFNIFENNTNLKVLVTMKK